MKRFLRDNCLSAVMFGLSALFVLGLGVAGARERAEDDGEHGRPPSSYAEYVSSGDFGQAVVENWESELLAIGVLLVLSVRLRDRGSPGRSRCPLRTAPPAGSERPLTEQAPPTRRPRRPERRPGRPLPQLQP